MSDYPLWAYRQQLEHQFKDELTNPYSDQGRVFDVKTAIDQKVQEFDRKQKQSHYDNVQQIKRQML